MLSRLGVEFSDEELGEMVRKSPKPCKYSRYEINASMRIGNRKICMKYVLHAQDVGLKTVKYA